MILSDYAAPGYYCEMTDTAAAAPVRERLAALSIEALHRRAAAAEAELYNLGITFTVYSDKDAIDRILPFDVHPPRAVCHGMAADRNRGDPAGRGAQPAARTTSTTASRS